MHVQWYCIDKLDESISSLSRQENMIEVIVTKQLRC